MRCAPVLLGSVLAWARLGSCVYHRRRSQPKKKAIANYLDEKTAAIDALIEKKRKLLVLLAEERAALINQAVTKGLDPAIPMKDSGIPWIGEIPAHWALLQLRRVLTKIEQGWSPQCDSRPATPGEWGVLKAGCTAGGRFEAEENKSLPNGIAPRSDIEVHAGDVVMSRASGSPKIVGSVALVEKVRPGLLLSDKLFRLRFVSRCADPAFAVASLASGSARAQIENAISGAEGLANNLPQAKVREIVVALPPLAEQKQIGAYVAERKGRIESVSSIAQNQINRLQEYRQALITAAVTGQLDIGAAP